MGGVGVPSIVGGLGGSGTLNRLAKFTPDGLNLGNSLLSDDGTNVSLVSGKFGLPTQASAGLASIYGGANVADSVGLRLDAGNLYIGFTYNDSGNDFAGVVPNIGYALGSGAVLRWSATAAATGAADLILARDAAHTLAQRNGANAQTFRIYGTYTDASNYERLALSTTAGSGATIAAETAGTGADNLNITLTPAGTGKVFSASSIHTTAHLSVGWGSRVYLDDLGAQGGFWLTAGGDGYGAAMVSVGANIQRWGTNVTLIQRALGIEAISPAQITANQNDYAPTDNNRGIWRLNSDAARTVTGIAIPSNSSSRTLVVVNVGSQNIVLANEHASSAAANRIITGTGADITLAADDTAILWYDDTTARWRVINSH